MLSSRIATAKLTLKVRARRSHRLNQAIRQVETMADCAAVRKLRERVAPVFQQDPTSAAKYAEPRQWVLLNAMRAADLGLDGAPGRRVLDIGCGPGFFVAMARALGHECSGVDAPETYFTAVEKDVYSSMTAALHCREVVSPLLIERFKPLPIRDQPFDLLTAFWICFNRHRQEDEWGVDEWRFFVEDALGCLRPGGKMVLDLNENPQRYGELRFYDAATRDYFCSKGSVDQGRVVVARP